MTASANKKPRTAVEEWNRAVREAYLTDVDDAIEESPEEVEKALLADGFDLAELDAFADATYERAVAKFGGAALQAPERKESSPESIESSAAWVAPSAPRPASARSNRSARARKVVWLAAAAAAAAATGGAVYLGTQHKEEPAPEPPPVNKPAPSAVAPPPVETEPQPAPQPDQSKASPEKGPK
jgi:hypothetical protein